MPATTEPCPDCGNDARRIETGTVRSVVELFGNRDIENDVQCRTRETRDCPVVDSTDEFDRQVEIDVSRERPDFESDAEPYPRWYCFGYDREHVQEDVAKNGETNIDDRITEHVQAEECVCRWKSPLGCRCLGDVRAAIAEAQEGRSR